MLEAVIDGRLPEVELEWDPRPAVCVILASGGYPGSYDTGKPIGGLDDFPESDDLFVFHAGTRLENGRVVTSGGRVLGVTALGATWPKPAPAPTKPPSGSRSRAATSAATLPPGRASARFVAMLPVGNRRPLPAPLFAVAALAAGRGRHSPGRHGHRRPSLRGARRQPPHPAASRLACSGRAPGRPVA